MRISALFAALVAIILIPLFAGATPARANHGSIQLSVPGSASIGAPLELNARILSAEDGTAIAGVSVKVEYLAEFAGERSFVVLGRAITDEEGVADLQFEPRVAGEHELRVSYSLPGEDGTIVESMTVTVSDSDIQQYTAESGIHIFGHEWILISVVATVWLVLLAVALGIADIARNGGVRGVSSPS
jgi:hypothetical protein